MMKKRVYITFILLILIVLISACTIQLPNINKPTLGCCKVADNTGTVLGCANAFTHSNCDNLYGDFVPESGGGTEFNDYQDCSIDPECSGLTSCMGVEWIYDSACSYLLLDNQYSCGKSETCANITAYCDKGSLTHYDCTLDQKVCDTLTGQCGTETFISPNLVLHMNFDDLTDDGRVPDLSGNENEGIFSLDSTYKPTLVGVGINDDKAYQFDGVDDYIKIENSPSLNIISPITLSAWIYPMGIKTGYKNIIGKTYTPSAEPYSYALTHQTSNGGAAFVARIGGHQSVYSQDPAPSNEWTHIIGTYDGTTMKIYINGEYSNSVTIPGQIDYTNYLLGIGSRMMSGTTADAYFSGIIDNIRIYNNLLTDWQIKELYLKEGHIICSSDTDCPSGSICHNPETYYSFCSACSTDGGSNPCPFGMTCASPDTKYSYCGENVLKYEFETSETPTPDSSGHENLGVVSGASFTSGIKDNAYYFDGQNAIITAQSNNLDITKKITLSVWIYPTFYDNGWDRIISKPLSYTWPSFPPYPYNFYSLILNNSGNPRSILFQLDIEGSAKSLIAPNAAPLNQWTHVVGTYDGFQQKIYINGELSNYTYLDGNIETAATRVWVGYWLYPLHSFNGKIDEVAIYNYALTDSQVSDLYCEGQGEISCTNDNDCAIYSKCVNQGVCSFCSKCGDNNPCQAGNCFDGDTKDSFCSECNDNTDCGGKTCHNQNERNACCVECESNANADCNDDDSSTQNDYCYINLDPCKSACGYTKQLSTNGYEPAIYGDNVVWAADEADDKNIYWYNLENKITKKITNYDTRQDDVHISKSYVVWHHAGNDNIYACNLAPGSANECGTNNDKQITGMGNQIHPDISGDIIVFEDHHESGDDYIYMCNLTAGSENECKAGNILLLPFSYKGINPIISGNRIAYQIPVVEFGLDIRVVNALGELIKHLSYSGDQINLAMYEDNLVWFDKRDNKIHVYNFISDKDIALETSTTLNDQTMPSIYKNRIVYNDAAGNIYLYDLTTDIETKIEATNPINKNPSVYENFVAYENEVSGQHYIYLAKIP